MVEIVAEIGVNHGGDMSLAIDMIEAAAICGADTVKFQTYNCEALDPPGKRREMLRKYQISKEDHFILRETAEKLNVGFLSTPFDMDSMEFLVVKLGIDRLKIASGFLGYGEFMQTAAETGLPLIVSTGMTVWSQMGVARINLMDAAEITWLHCTSSYPCPDRDVNLNAIKNLKRNFEHVGFSDHSFGETAAIGAVALGACMIEKHFTMDVMAEGPDHLASAPPHIFKNMASMCRQVEEQIGQRHIGFKASERAALAILEERKEWREET